MGVSAQQAKYKFSPPKKIRTDRIKTQHMWHHTVIHKRSYTKKSDVLPKKNVVVLVKSEATL